MEYGVMQAAAAVQPSAKSSDNWQELLDHVLAAGLK